MAVNSKEALYFYEYEVEDYRKPKLMSGLVNGSIDADHLTEAIENQLIEVKRCTALQVSRGRLISFKRIN